MNSGSVQEPLQKLLKKVQQYKAVGSPKADKKQYQSIFEEPSQIQKKSS